jgi:Bacterial Ig-like domain (group 3)/FG-GAP repeat
VPTTVKAFPNSLCEVKFVSRVVDRIPFASGSSETGLAILRAEKSYGLDGYQAFSVAVADVNGDSHPDLVVAYGCQDEACGNGVAGVLLRVGSIPTTTTEVSSSNPSAYFQPVTLTATVRSSSGTRTGTVEFYDGSSALGSATLASGSGALSITSLSVGSHGITAVYQGSLKFNSSASSSLTQVVTVENTTTSIGSSRNPVSLNQRVTYTATVTGQYGGAVTGSVTFSDGGVAVATITLNRNQTTYTTSYKTRATHVMTATYSGDSNNASSISSSLAEQVEGFASRTAVTTSGSPSQMGQPVTFTATVTSKKGSIPDGELVTFYDGKTVLGSVALANEKATFTTSTLSAKKHTIKASYGGDDNFNPSSGVVSQIVEE